MKNLDFDKISPVDYIVECYKAIPKNKLNHRIIFLHSILGGPHDSYSYTASGEEGMEKMLKSDIDKLEPEFYEWAKTRGYKIKP